MRMLSKIGNGRGIHADWFSCDGEISGPFCFQDTIHNGTKLRNVFLRTISNPKRLPFGKYFINWAHLNILLNEFPKDQHLLTASVLNPVDRQNFQSVLKICDPRVTELLERHVKSSKGTVLFLQMVKDLMDAFLDQSLQPLQRIRKVWYPIFIFRIWRHFITKHKEYTLKDHFLTNPCYTSLEINAHSLVMCMLYLREIKRPDLFLPHIFESQPCESLFRQLRSFCSTYSTKSNYTVKDALSLISKFQIQNDIINETSLHFVYPRLNKNAQKSKNTELNIQLPTKNAIIAEIQKCQQDAIAKAKSLGLIPNRRFTGFCCGVPPYTLNDCSKVSKNKSAGNFSNNEYDFDNIQLKNFADKLSAEIDPTGPYVEIITEDGERKIFKKMSLCWLWREESKKLSSDRLLRVQYHAKKPQRMKKKIKTATIHLYKPTNKRRKRR